MCRALQVWFEAQLLWCNHIRQVDPYPNSWKLTQDLMGGYPGLRVVPYTHSQLIKVQEHFIHMILMCEVLQVRLEAQPWCNHIRQVGPYPNSWKLTLDLMGGIRLRVVPYTRSLLIKVQEHFMYIWYGFVKHFKWGLRLNHDVPTFRQVSPRSLHPPSWCYLKTTQQGCRIPIHSLFRWQNSL